MTTLTEKRLAKVKTLGSTKNTRNRKKRKELIEKTNMLVKRIEPDS